MMCEDGYGPTSANLRDRANNVTRSESTQYTQLNAPSSPVFDTGATYALTMAVTSGMDGFSVSSDCSSGGFGTF